METASTSFCCWCCSAGAVEDSDGKERCCCAADGGKRCGCEGRAEITACVLGVLCVSSEEGPAGPSETGVGPARDSLETGAGAIAAGPILFGLSSPSPVSSRMVSGAMGEKDGEGGKAGDEGTEETEEVEETLLRFWCPDTGDGETEVVSGAEVDGSSASGPGPVGVGSG